MELANVTESYAIQQLLSNCKKSLKNVELLEGGKVIKLIFGFGEIELISDNEYLYDLKQLEKGVLNPLVKADADRPFNLLKKHMAGKKSIVAKAPTGRLDGLLKSEKTKK